MFGKLRKHRTFQYTPRFYKPEEDERKRPKIRIRPSARSAHRRSMVFMIAAIGFVLYILFLLSRIGK